MLIGGAIVLLALFGWSLEPSVADDADFVEPPAEGEGPPELGDGGEAAPKELNPVG